MWGLLHFYSHCCLLCSCLKFFWLWRVDNKEGILSSDKSIVRRLRHRNATSEVALFDSPGQAAWRRRSKWQSQQSCARFVGILVSWRGNVLFLQSQAHYAPTFLPHFPPPRKAFLQRGMVLASEGSVSQPWRTLFICRHVIQAWSRPQRQRDVHAASQRVVVLLHANQPQCDSKSLLRTVRYSSLTCTQETFQMFTQKASIKTLNESSHVAQVRGKVHAARSVIRTKLAKENLFPRPRLVYKENVKPICHQIQIQCF